MRRRTILAILAVAIAAGCRAKPKEPDVAALLADLQSPDADKSGKASLAIVAMGDAAVPGLVEMLGSADPKLRNRAASTLWGLGDKAKAAVPALAKTLGDADAEVRRSAATALGNMGASAAPAVPALTAALKDRDTGVRQLAAKALGAIGPAAATAVPALAEAGRAEGVKPATDEAIRQIQGRR